MARPHFSVWLKNTVDNLFSVAKIPRSTRGERSMPDNRSASRKICEAVDAAGRARDQRALMIAITALRDIANGAWETLPLDVANAALAEIDALSGNPFERIEGAAQ
jgi:hypothetical protein